MSVTRSFSILHSICTLASIITFCSTQKVMEPIGPSTIADSKYKTIDDRCCIDVFHHIDSYFLISWTALNDDGYSQIIGTIRNTRNLSHSLRSFDVSPSSNDHVHLNYSHISTSYFKSRPNEIVFSFLSEQGLSIRVFGGKESIFSDESKSSLFWSPTIPITNRTDIGRHSVQCLESDHHESIILVYEHSNNIYHSILNQKYEVSFDNEPINDIIGASDPFIVQSLTSPNVLISYISNRNGGAIHLKMYILNSYGTLTAIPESDSILVSVRSAIKYYQIIPLRIGGFVVLYSTENALFLTVIDNEGNRVFEVNFDILIAKQNGNGLARGSMVELTDSSSIWSNSGITYILVTFMRSPNDEAFGAIYRFDGETAELRKVSISGNTVVFDYNFDFNVVPHP